MVRLTARKSRLFSMLLLLTATPAVAQMIPLADDRSDGAHAIYQGDWEDQKASTPPVPFAYWNDITEARAERYEPCPDDPSQQCLIGSCWGAAFQTSEFFPYGIQFTGGTGAGWGIPPSGLWSVQSAVGFTFRVDHQFDYNLWIDVDPGDDPGGGVTLWAYHSTGNVILHSVSAGVSQFNGRLGPGTYQLTGISAEFNAFEDFQGAVYAAQWTIQRPQAPHVAFQPSDQSVGCNGTAMFSVITTMPPGNYTYQWRRNFVPLTNGPGVTGATASTLILTNVCTAGDYDVVVTGPNPVGGGTIAEPSRLAHLNIITTPTGVEVEPQSPLATAVRAPAPNPFQFSTSVAYEVGRPTHLIATVFSASGARIRSLADRTVSSPGSVTWDGRLPSGERAPAGIYFVRVELGETHRTGKVLLLQ
ncbi:MAG TPA: hypothetical protein VFP58_10320 [Candidatus Eisenbacteria bacterium]|nr:hypothetical protein [Candidatus Eisenbacteria bacterium]